MYPNNGSNLAEQQGFEPWQHFHALRDFESRLFDHLSTAPYDERGYYSSHEGENQGFCIGLDAQL